MLKQRLLTSIALIAILLFVLTAEHPAVWPAFLAIFASFAAEEWAGLHPDFARTGFFYALLTGLLALFLLQGEVFPHIEIPLCLLSAAFWVGLVPFWLVRAWHLPRAFLHALVGWIVILPTLVALHVLLKQGASLLLAVLVVIWVSDISAYFVGRAWGKHRLAPVISPGKTWEGVLGALTGVLALGLMGPFVGSLGGALKGSLDHLDGALIPLMGLIAILGIEGDLFESWLKRCAGVKDSGWILPGHGGVLDRIDALTAALPLTVLCLHWTVGGTGW